jgi:hypothetical protein
LVTGRGTSDFRSETGWCDQLELRLVRMTVTGELEFIGTDPVEEFIEK